VERWLSTHASVLYALHEAVGGMRPSGLQRSTLLKHHQEIAKRLSEAFRSGELVAFRRPPPSVSRQVQPKSPPPEPLPAEPVTEEPDSYVNIRLVGEDGNGLPGMRYRIVLPDSSVREGRLDGGGSATVRGRFSGTCKVTFPDLDAGAWEAA